jgi:hypothetical protein
MFVPQTLENTREADVTMVSPGDEEVALDEADDEFAGEPRGWRGGGKGGGCWVGGWVLAHRCCVRGVNRHSGMMSLQVSKGVWCLHTYCK